MTAALSKADLRKELETCTITNPDPTWLQRVFTYHGIPAKKAEALLAELTMSGRYSLDEGRWVILPKVPAVESDLYSPFKTLIKAIFDHMGRSTIPANSRKLKISASEDQTHQESHRPSEQDKKVATRPDVLIVGHDPKFLPNSLNTRLPSEFLRAISVGDIKREDGHEGEEEILSQVAMYAR